MKKILATISALCCFLLTSCNFNLGDIIMKEAGFDYAIYGVGIEKTLPLSWKGVKENSSIEFKSSNESIATVNAEGEVVGKNEGSVIITAKSKWAQFSCTVEVNNGKYKELTGEENLVKWEGRNFTYKKTMNCYNAASGFEVLFYGTSFSAEIAAGTRQYPVTMCVMIDDLHTPQDNNIVLDSDGNTYSYVLAENLPEGFHKIRVYKLTEAYESSVAFKSMETDGYFWARSNNKKYKIEVYGDSITTGVDNLEGVGNVPVGYLKQNGCMTYSWLAAEQVGADINIFARNGIGMNWSWDMGIYMKTQFKRTYCAEHNFLNVKTNPTWNFQSYIPDVVIINVGTNDTHCGNGFDEDAYIKEIRKLCQTLNEEYGTQTKLLLCSGIITSVNIPALFTVAKEFQNAEVLNLPYVGRHPIIEEHQEIAQVLAKKLSELLK